MHLRAEGIRWLEDPSNEAARFARVRARRELRETAETDALIVQAGASAQLAMRSHGAARIAAGLFMRHDAGETRFSAELLDHPGGPMALAALAVAAGARTRDIPEEAATGLLRRLRKDGHTALGGAQFIRSGDAIMVCRDPGGVHGRRGGGKPHPVLDLAPGHPAVWDSRLELTTHEAGWTARPHPDGRTTDPALARFGQDSAPGDAVAARWLVEARQMRLLWRGTMPPFR